MTTELVADALRAGEKRRCGGDARRGQPHPASARLREDVGLLAEEQAVLDGNWWGYPEGTVIGHATYLERGVVDELKERPAP